MARNPRITLPGYAYHVTQRGSNKQPVFRTTADRHVYLNLMEELIPEAGIRLLSYCLMTNHVHFVVVPDRGDSLSVWMRRVNGRYAQYFNAKLNRTGHLWQARFYSCILSPRHLSVALRYVEQNPVRAYLVQNPQDYRWSSAKAHLNGKLDKMLDQQDWQERGREAGWTEMLSTKPVQPIVHLLKRCTYGGRPFGGAQFISQIEAEASHHWARWPYHQELKDSEVLMSLEGMDADSSAA